MADKANRDLLLMEFDTLKARIATAEKRSSTMESRIIQFEEALVDTRVVQLKYADELRDLKARQEEVDRHLTQIIGSLDSP